MNSTTDARRNSPAGPPAATRESLRQVRDQIAADEAIRTTLREKQATHLTQALNAGATVREVVDAAGLSRTYLHRAGLPLYAGATPAPRAANRATELASRATERGAALTKSAEIRDQVADLKSAITDAKTQRVDLVTQLLATGADQATIAADAGVSPEWIRRLAKRS
jgi:hypothetical protein